MMSEKKIGNSRWIIPALHRSALGLMLIGSLSVTSCQPGDHCEEGPCISTSTECEEGQQDTHPPVEDTDTEDPEDEVWTGEARLRATVLDVDVSDCFEDVEVYEDRIVATMSCTPDQAGIEQGTVLMGSEGYGYARRVLSYEITETGMTLLPDEETWTFWTAAASLAELLEGEIEIDEYIDLVEVSIFPDDARALIDETYQWSNGGVSSQAEIGAGFGESSNGTLSDATLSGTFHFVLYVSPDREVEELTFELIGTATLDLYPYAFATGTVEWAEEQSLGSVLIGPIPAGPVTLYVEVELSAGMEASVTGNISVSEGGLFVEASLNTGLSYTSSLGWVPIEPEPSFDPETYPFLIDASASGSAELYLKPETALLLYGVAGGTLALKNYVRAEAEVNPLRTNYDVYYGLSATAGVEIGAFGYELIDYEYEFPPFTEEHIWEDERSNCGTEVCGDGTDNDCDGDIDEEDASGCSTYYADVDGDGYGSTDGKCLCEPTGSYDAEDASDCDDSDAAQNPNADEYCNGEDDDCDDNVDEAGAADCATYYLDEDGDGYGTSDSACLCAPSGDYDALGTGDCNDGEPLAWTGNTEVCDGVDNDCDGTADNSDSSDSTTWYADEDGDGYGDSTSTTTACSQPSGFVGNTGDCDDDEPLAWSGHAESCDSVDNDCDGTTDEGCTTSVDADGDGYYADTDCDDADPLSHPGATEICDGVDNDCNGPIDDGCSAPTDADGDGYSTDTDCDDTDSTINPGATEICDGVDNDCQDGVDDGELDPNGALASYSESLYLGYLEDTNGSFCSDGSAILFPAGDDDWYMFEYEETLLGFVSIEVTVEPPPASEEGFSLSLWRDVGVGFEEVEYTIEESEADITFGGSFLSSDSGIYYVNVTRSGESCEPYAVCVYDW